MSTDKNKEGTKEGTAEPISIEGLQAVLERLFQNIEKSKPGSRYLSPEVTEVISRYGNGRLPEVPNLTFTHKGELPQWLPPLVAKFEPYPGTKKA